MKPKPLSGIIRILLSAALLISVSNGSYANPVASAPDVVDEPEIKQFFDNYTNSVFLEKVYVHTDKDSYLSGETMWMRAYRMDAMNHFPMYYSGIVYMDIRNAENKLINRMMIVKTDSCFQATYKIDPELPTGYYDLVAYTNWMQNFDSDFYFRKRFYVYNFSDNNISSTITFDPDTSAGKIKATVRTLGVGEETYPKAAMVVTPYVGEKEQKLIELNSDQNGDVSFTLPSDEGITGVEIKFKDDKPLKYRKYFEIPAFEYAFDVQFLPEGGHLLNGVSQNVGFKAIGPDGKGINVSGTVKDSAGNDVAIFSSAHLGMGSFILEPKEGEKYTASVTTESGREASFALPEVASAGVALSTSMRGNVLTCRVLTTEGYNIDGLYLGFHMRGKSYRWVPLANAMNFNLPMVSLPQGVMHFFVVNESGEVFSERIVFINNDLSPQVKATGLRPSYGRRQKVDVNLEVLYGENTPLPSEMSVSVVDPKTTTLDKDGNIVSYVFLSSDIKGKVEDPAYYFDRSVNAAERARDADLLMMTQGWKRFDIGAVLRKEVPKFDFPVELGQSISGNIKRIWSDKSVADGKLTMMGVNPSRNVLVISTVEADEKGNFSVVDISFPDSTEFVVQGTQGKGKKNVEVKIEPQTFRPYSFKAWDGRCFYNPGQVAQADSVVDKIVSSGRKYFYEDGQRIFALDGVNIMGRGNGLSEEVVQLNNYANAKTSGTQMANDGYISVRDWLEANGVQIRIPSEGTEEELFINGKPANLVFEGLGRTVRDLLTMSMSDIDGIWIFRDQSNFLAAVPYAEFDFNFGGGIYVTLKFGKASEARETLSFFRFTPMGYSIPDKFYSPKYGADSKDNEIPFDERSTVYWNPNVKTGIDGKANISFYTTDVPADLIMTVQGMSDNGLPIYMVIPVKSSF